MGEKRVEQEKWRREIEWREREFELRQAELRSTRHGQHLTVASIVISALAIGGSVFASLRVADMTANAARYSAESAASSAQSSAQTASRSALESAQQSASAVIASAEKSASAAQRSAQESARAARESLERKWDLDMREDQRKSIASLTAEYVAALLPALDQAQEITAKAHILGIEPSLQEIDVFDQVQRKNMRALQHVETKVYMENREVSFAFAPMYSQLRRTNEEIMSHGRETRNSKDFRMFGWCLLNTRMLRMKLRPVLDSIREAQQRQGVAAPRLKFVAPPSDVVAVDRRVADEEDLRSCRVARGR